MFFVFFCSWRCCWLVVQDYISCEAHWKTTFWDQKPVSEKFQVVQQTKFALVFLFKNWEDWIGTHTQVNNRLSPTDTGFFRGGKEWLKLGTHRKVSTLKHCRLFFSTKKQTISFNNFWFFNFLIFFFWFLSFTVVNISLCIFQKSHEFFLSYFLQHQGENPFKPK